MRVKLSIGLGGMGSEADYESIAGCRFNHFNNYRLYAY
jgi:hypothetical protein